MNSQERAEHIKKLRERDRVDGEKVATDHKKDYKQMEKLVRDSYNKETGSYEYPKDRGVLLESFPALYSSIECNEKVKRIIQSVEQHEMDPDILNKLSVEQDSYANEFEKVIEFLESHQQKDGSYNYDSSESALRKRFGMLYYQMPTMIKRLMEKNVEIDLLKKVLEQRRSVDNGSATYKSAYTGVTTSVGERAIPQQYRRKHTNGSSVVNSQPATQVGAGGSRDMLINRATAPQGQCF